MPTSTDSMSERFRSTAPSGIVTPSLLGGAYEGASRYSRELSTWRPTLQHVDADVIPSKRESDARSIDIARNDAYVQGGINLHKNSIIGPRIRLNCKPDWRYLGLSEEWQKEFAEEVESQFGLYAESPMCWPDASRKNTLTGLARLAISHYLMTGEVLAVAEWIRTGNRPYSTALQLISSDRLGQPHQWDTSYTRTRGGVRMNRAGAPIGYHIKVTSQGVGLFHTRPDEFRYVRKYLDHGRIQVIHLFEAQRPAQTRGISMLVAALKETKVARSYRDIVLQNAAVSASFAAVIKSDLPHAEALEQIQGKPFEAVQEYMTGYLSAQAKYQDNADNLKLDGVRIPVMLPGSDLSIHPMGHPGGIGDDFEKSLIRYLAAALGVSYEELSKDYTDTNYSSARAAGIETWKNMQALKSQISDPFCTHVFRLWFEEAVNAGHLSTMNRRTVPNMYDKMNMDAFTMCQWGGPGRGQIDPVKETDAAIKRIQAGISTSEEEIAHLGGSWEKTYPQLAREISECERLGLTHPMNREIIVVQETEKAKSENSENNEPGNKNN